MLPGSATQVLADNFFLVGDLWLKSRGVERG
jgi:hypothetical protein